jgi:transglutaminase superfamily protein
VSCLVFADIQRKIDLRVGKNHNPSATRPAAVPDAEALLVQPIILRHSNADALLNRPAEISLRSILTIHVTGRAFAMSFLVLKAYLKLIYFDFYLARGDFAALYNQVRKHPISSKPARLDAVEQICSAVDMACIWYWKEALCLQRSAATACLLKRYGVPAQLVIGAQQMPFKAHAWVEVHGRVVNDKSYTPEMYAVLDRC